MNCFARRSLLLISFADRLGVWFPDAGEGVVVPEFFDLAASESLVGLGVPPSLPGFGLLSGVGEDSEESEVASCGLVLSVVLAISMCAC